MTDEQNVDMTPPDTYVLVGYITTQCSGAPEFQQFENTVLRKSRKNMPKPFEPLLAADLLLNPGRTK